MPVSNQFGWIGPDAAVAAKAETADHFQRFAIRGKTDRRRVCAWDSWNTLGLDINRTILHRQLIGDCVSFGAAIAVYAVAAHEIVRLGERERIEVPFPPYLYGCSRLMPEGGNGRINGDGSTGSWAAATIQKYGVLRENFDEVPQYSAAVAKRWGSDRKALSPFFPEGKAHLIKSAAPVKTVDDVIEAICNGYFVTIASSRGYEMKLRDRDGKSWFVGNDTWMHQTSLLAYDPDPVDCFYRRNQWGDAHGKQLDGPDGGGWITADQLAPELAKEYTEAYAYSLFDGFPSEETKPRNYFS